MALSTGLSDVEATLLREGRRYTPRGYEQITSLSSATGLNVPSDANVVAFQAEVSDLRWRDDGTDPTSSVGMILAAGSDMFYVGDLDALKFIELGADGILNVTYYDSRV